MRIRKRSMAASVLGLGVGLGFVASRANAANYYFDVNGTTAGSGVVEGGIYNWNDALWNNNVSAGTATTINYVNGNFPRFAAAADAMGSYTLNLATDISCVGMIMEDGPPTPVPPGGGNTLTLNGPGKIAVDGAARQGFIVRGSSNLKVFNQIVDGSGAANTDGVSFSTATGGTGSGSLFLYSPTGNTYTGGTTIATSGGLNILFGDPSGAGAPKSSISTGPLEWTTNATVIADPDATGPITLSNTLTGMTGARSTTSANVSIILTGAQKMTFTAPTLPITPGTGASTTIGAFIQIFQVGNSTFPSAVAQIDSAITQTNATYPMPVFKTGSGTLILTNANNTWGTGATDTKVANGKLVIGNATAIPATNLLVDGTGATAPVVPPIAQYRAGLSSAAKMITIKTVGAGSVDLTDNSLIITTFNNLDPGLGTMSLQQVQALVKSGYNAGAWNGAGIDSSSAANNVGHHTAIGFGDNTILHKSTFKGVALDANGVNANDILLKYTYYGDADLDGDVDVDDVGRWANNFTGTDGSTTKTWTEGDWDYDGDVDVDDVGKWATNFTGTDGGTLNITGASIEAVQALESLGFTVVPEPASLGLLGLGAAGLLGRRRRRAV